MKTKLIGASLMLGAIIACKKKDNKPSLEPLGTTWELEKYEGTKKLDASKFTTKSWLDFSIYSPILSNPIAYTDFLGTNTPAEFLPFIWEIQEGTTIDEDGDETITSYNSEGLLRTSEWEECEKGEAIVSTNDWFTKGDDSKMIELIKQKYLKTEICRKTTDNEQFKFSLSGNKLNYTGFKGKSEAVYYEKSTEEEIGKQTMTITGSWNLSYVKK